MNRFAQANPREMWLSFASGVAIALGSSSAVAAVPQPLIQLARAKSQVVVKLAEAEVREGQEIQLIAFDRPWGEPIPIRNGMVELETPDVRTPVVFELTPPSEPNRRLAELVVYPSRLAAEPNLLSDVRVLDLDAPVWFGDWAAAIGIEHVRLSDKTALLARPALSDTQTAEILVVGAGAAGAGLRDAVELGASAEINVLILEAPWFGPRVQLDQPVDVDSLAAMLEHVGERHWAHPPRFTWSQAPPKVICNRRIIAKCGDMPCAESFCGAKGFNATAAYVPWVTQLGRNDTADELLIELIRSAASFEAPQQRGTRIRLLPPGVELDNRLVLRAAMCDQTSSQTLVVVDLRGNSGRKRDVLDAIELVESSMERKEPLLILGDYRDLVKRVWDEHQEPEDRIDASIAWIADDDLPSSDQTLILLQDALTRFSVVINPECKP